MIILTLYQESLWKTFYYVSTYFTVVEQQAENLLSFVVKGKLTLYQKQPQSAASDNLSDLNEEKVSNITLYQSPTIYYNGPKDHLPDEDSPSPYLQSRCFLCFPSALPDHQLP